MFANLSLGLQIHQLVNNLVFAFIKLLGLSIFCLSDCFNKVTFKFINELLLRVQFAVDSSKLHVNYMILSSVPCMMTVYMVSLMS